MSAQIWIVSEVGWEFDDSRYYRPEFGNIIGTPKLAFTIPELAKKVCDEKNISRVRSLGGLSEYIDRDDLAYSFDDDEEFEDFCRESGLDSYDLSFSNGVESISDERILSMLSKAGIQFYEVVNVELLA